jgi:hypothetical protein
LAAGDACRWAGEKMIKHATAIVIVAATLLGGCVSRSVGPPNSAERITVDYAIHFTNIHIEIDPTKVDYDKRLQGPGEYYELPLSPEILASLAAPILESSLFTHPQKNYGDLGPAVWFFKVKLTDGTTLSRHIAHSDIPNYPEIRMWLSESHISKKFSGLLKGKDCAEQPPERDK